VVLSLAPRVRNQVDFLDDALLFAGVRLSAGSNHNRSTEDPDTFLLPHQVYENRQLLASGAAPADVARDLGGLSPLSIAGCLPKSGLSTGRLCGPVGRRNLLNFIDYAFSVTPKA